MAIPKIERKGKKLIVERTLSGTTDGGLSVKLIRNYKECPENLGLIKGMRVRLTQSADGKRGSWEVIE
jgi:hypothetical protein